MSTFEQSGFTYDDLEEGMRISPTERSIAEGVTVEDETSFDGETKEEDVYKGLKLSGVDIEPFEQFYSDGAVPELHAK